VKVDHRELTPPYVRLLIRLVRPFPNWDFFFIKSLRQKAVETLQFKSGSRVLDAGCGSGGTFPFLADAIGPLGEVVGIEISPEAAINARRRIEANNWKNVYVVEGDAKTVKLNGTFDGLVMFAAPDIYASPEAVGNLFAYLKNNARIVVFGAKLSKHPPGALLNILFRALMKLSFSSTPALNYEPLGVLRNRLVDLQIREYIFGCMFLAWGSIESSVTTENLTDTR
jgi:SAM-dependent methyltransferase